MFRCVVWLVLLLLFSPALSLGDTALPRAKVGAILALSGGGAESGEACRNGMHFALSELEPSLRKRIDIIFEDDRMTPTNTLSAFRRLTSVEHIDVAVTFTSGPSKAVAPVAEQQKIPLIAIASDPNVVAGKRYAFNLWVPPASEADVLLQEMRRRGFRKIARVVANQDAMLAIKRAFDDLNHGAIDVVVDEEYNVGETDFRAFLLKVKGRKDIDAIHTDLFFGQVGLFAKQARELGITVPLTNVEIFEDSSEVQSSAGALVGNWYVQADDPDSGFLDAYRKKFPGASTLSAGNCHDAVMLVAEALRSGVNFAEFHTFLSELKDFHGSMGTFSATGDQRFTLPATVKVVTKDGFEKLVRGEVLSESTGTKRSERITPSTDIPDPAPIG